MNATTASPGTRRPPGEAKRPLSILPFFLILAAVWTAIVGLLLAWDFWRDALATEAHARLVAQSSFEKDILYQQWVTMHGGVYVPVTDRTPPNPYLTNVVEREITTPSGRRLTLMNHAYMARQVHDEGRERFHYQGHITSLNPIQPANAADAWETNALRAFARGTQEVCSVETVEGQPQLRFMRPMVAEAGCVKCHGAQGYQAGDIHGGISISVPLAPYQAAARAKERGEIFAHGAIWLLGLAGLGGGFTLARRRQQERACGEATLRASEGRFRDLFESAPVAYQSLDPGGRILEVNAAWQNLLGYPREEALGRSLAEFLEPSQAPLLRDSFQRFKETGQVGGAEFVFLRKDGAPVRASITGRTGYDEGGQHKQTHCVLFDLTERKRSEEIHARLEAQLRQAQKMEVVGQLAGGVAHDFNNILTAVLMNLELLREEPGLTPEGRLELKEVEQQAQRAAALTRQLLLYARRQTMQAQTLDLSALLGNLLKMLCRLIGEHIHLEFQGGHVAAWLQADPGMLEQVVVNLVVNARDAMPKGGRITLGLRRLELDAARALANPEARPGKFVCLSVADTGCGMDEATQARLFEPFFTTKDVGRGTGLGLATVHGIVQQHEGWIEVESAAGQGSTFRVYLPASAEADAAGGAGKAEPPVPGGTETILVVEDEAAVRTVMVLTLRRYGYQVLEARHGVEALKRWREHEGRVDLVVSDVVMPEGLTGLELARELRELKPGLPVILMSGYSAELMAHGFEAPEGMAFLQKPFPPVVLARKIRECLPPARPAV